MSTITNIIHPPAISRLGLVCLAAGSACSVLLLFDGIINQRLSDTLHHVISMLFIVASILMLADLTSLSESKEIHHLWRKVQTTGTIISSLGSGACITGAVLDFLGLGSTVLLPIGTFFSLLGIAVVGLSACRGKMEGQPRYFSLLAGIFCLQLLLQLLLLLSLQQTSLYHFICGYTILWMIVRYVAWQESRKAWLYNYTIRSGSPY